MASNPEANVQPSRSLASGCECDGSLPGYYHRAAVATATAPLSLDLHQDGAAFTHSTSANPPEWGSWDADEANSSGSRSSPAPIAVPLLVPWPLPSPAHALYLAGTNLALEVPWSSHAPVPGHRLQHEPSQAVDHGLEQEWGVHGGLENCGAAEQPLSGEALESRRCHLNDEQGRSSFTAAAVVPSLPSFSSTAVDFYSEKL
jgi:hypothetical protein